jgi:hypothetical protein
LTAWIARCTGNGYVGPNADTPTSITAGVVTVTGNENESDLTSVMATPHLSNTPTLKFVVMSRCKEPKVLSMVTGLIGFLAYTMTLPYRKELFSY